MNHQGQPESVAKFVSFAILASIFLFGFFVLRPFMPAMLWALTLGIALAPLHRRLEQILWNRRSLATAIIALLLLLFLFLPMLGLSRALIAFVPDFIVWLDTVGVSPDPESTNAPALEKVDSVIQQDLQAIWRRVQADIALLQSYVGSDLKPFAFWLLGEGRMLGSFVLEFALGIVLATTLLHQQDAVSALLGKFFGRVGGDLARRMVHHGVATVRATVVSVLVAAAAQSVVASAAYIVSGVPHWVILAALTFLLAMFQIGPVLIWAPIALWLGVQGQIGLAIFVILWGVFAVGMVDNLVRTALVARASDMPGLLAFMAAIGGLMVWGIVGVFLGPVIVAVCLKLTLEWTDGTSMAATLKPNDHS